MGEVLFQRATTLGAYLKAKGYRGDRLQALLDSTIRSNGLTGADPTLAPGTRLTIPFDTFGPGGAPSAAVPSTDARLDEIGRGNRPRGEPARPPARTLGPSAAGTRPPSGTPEELRRAVADLESRGGSGRWFTSTAPEKLGGETGSFYLIEALPPKASPLAAMLLLRTEGTRAALEEVLLREKAPVVLGMLPLTSQVEAAALGGTQLSADALQQGGVVDKKHIILLTPDAYLTQLAHENRHWLDYEDPTFTVGLKDQIRSVVADPSLVDLLAQITLEIRGHIVQARQARAALAAGLPYLDRAGTVRDGSRAELERSYGFEQLMARNAFEQAYLPYLDEVFASLDPTQKDRLLAVLSKYDSSDDPDNAITFRKMMHIR